MANVTIVKDAVRYLDSNGQYHVFDAIKGDTGPQGAPGGTMTQAQMIDLIYPVGSIYMSANSTNPGTLFSGTTWTAIQGRFLLGANSTYTAGTLGGEATHTLTVDEMPSHKHTITAGWGSGKDGGGDDRVKFTGKLNPTNVAFMSEVGGGLAHNNMPPYLAVYIWQRTA